MSGLEKYKKRLEEVNSLIERIAAESEYITPITMDDYELFSRFFSKEKDHTYGNSWIYVTQGTFGIGEKNLGYKYYDGSNLCALAIYPKIEEPDTIMLYWIRPLGENMVSVISDLARHIKAKYGICSYVKKLFFEQYEFLLKNGFQSTLGFPWHSLTHSEDDTYPEVIYDRENTLYAAKHSTRRSQLGRMVKEIEKFKKENSIEIISDGFKDHAWSIVNEYFKIRGELSSKLNVSSQFDYYNMIFSVKNNDPNIDRKILIVNDKPVGFYTTMQDPKFDTTSIYSYIALRNHYKNLTDLLKIFVFNEEKAKYVNGGGSEDVGIYQFKKKFLPVAERLMYWATNYSG